MDKLIEIAKANGADYELDYADDSSPASKQEYITFTPDQLRATVEKVCAPLLSFARKEALLGDLMGNGETRASIALSEYRILIGDKE